MAIAIDFPMFDTTNAKLSKSADALESALAQMSKGSLVSNDHNSSEFFAPSATSGSGFDEWLATDLSFGAFSSDESTASSSPFSSMEDSPVLGFDSFGSSAHPPLFDVSLGLSGMLAYNEMSTPVEIKSPALPMLTSTAVQQAAAALNIPWSAELESAVMAQAALGAAVASVPVAQPIASPVLTPKIEPEERSFPSSASSPASSRAASASPEASSSATSPRPKGSKKRQLSPEEEAGEIVAKRAKNTDAARRSRLKKLIKLEGLEAKVSDLEAANNALNMKIAILETEKNGFIVKDAEQTARIAQLEAQLAEAHVALTNRSS
ncbi:hypothetical protein BGZ99_009548 [Dissophora globulifera]|uniref:BZIP domain-containing protein n=1 Tax=Dissophora globulifera TaxID=979702 RepID=A0A9P6R6M6_9FUNG|nr:hypothetical protein BGZ99_009548 [Dissophora globulifera]